MRVLALALVAALLLTPGAAEADRGIPIVRDSVAHLDFVAETGLTSRVGQPLSLCHAYRAERLYWLGLWMTSDGYVLSDTACTGPEVIDDEVMIAQAFSFGQVPDGVSRMPRFSLVQNATGHAWILIGAALLATMIIRRAIRAGLLRRKSRVEERMEVLGLPDGAIFRFIDAMIHAASADGKAQTEEVEFIRDKATEVAQLEYSAEHIEWAIGNADRLKSPRDFQRFGRGLTPEQSRMVLRAALAVVAADGQMTRAERRFIAQLTAGLMLDPADVDRILGPQDATGGAALA